MRVRVTVVGEHPEPHVEWPEGWPIPPLDAEVSIGDGLRWVRAVAYYPEGEDEDTEPFIYLVLGPRRPHWVGSV